MIRIFKIENGDIFSKEIKGDLESLQKEVGGSEIITLCPYWPELDEIGIDLYADDNGMLVESPKYSLVEVDDKTGEIKYGVFGNVIFAGHDDDGNTIGLTDEQMAFITDHLKIAGYARYGNDRSTMSICYKFDFGGEHNE